MNILLYIIIIILVFFIINNYLKNKKKGVIKKYDTAILIFHLCWTDIFNSLSLINYYSKKYIKLYVVMRNDALDIVNFFIRDLNNIELIIINNQDFIENRVCDVISICKHVITNKKISKEILNNSEYLFHGLGDIFRDKYQYKFILYNLINNKNFVNYFYESYDISSSIRIDNFIFTRDYELEDITYKKFIKENGKKYILYHSNDDNTDFIINKTSEKYINLNKKTNTFFDYIKILENSIELHLIDSSWAVFIYLLDAKYNLFKNKKIYLYAKRGYIKMFQDPILLNNWIFIKNLYSDTLLINIFTYSSNYISFYYKKLKNQMKYIM